MLKNSELKKKEYLNLATKQGLTPQGPEHKWLKNQELDVHIFKKLATNRPNVATQERLSYNEQEGSPRVILDQGLNENVSPQRTANYL